MSGPDLQSGDQKRPGYGLFIKATDSKGKIMQDPYVIHIPYVYIYREICIFI